MISAGGLLPKGIDLVQESVIVWRSVSFVASRDMSASITEDETAFLGCVVGGGGGNGTCAGRSSSKFGGDVPVLYMIRTSSQSISLQETYISSVTVFVSAFALPSALPAAFFPFLFG